MDCGLSQLSDACASTRREQHLLGLSLRVIVHHTDVRDAAILHNTKVIHHADQHVAVHAITKHACGILPFHTDRYLLMYIKSRHKA